MGGGGAWEHGQGSGACVSCLTAPSGRWSMGGVRARCGVPGRRCSARGRPGEAGRRGRRSACRTAPAPPAGHGRALLEAIEDICRALRIPRILLCSTGARLQPSSLQPQPAPRSSTPRQAWPCPAEPRLRSLAAEQGGLAPCCCATPPRPHTHLCCLPRPARRRRSHQGHLAAPRLLLHHH